MITRKNPVYNTVTPFSPLSSVEKEMCCAFCLRLPTPLPTETGTLFSVGGSLTGEVLRVAKENGGELARALKAENCFYFNDEETVLRIRFGMRKTAEQHVGFFELLTPFPLFAEAKELCLYFDGVALRLLVDGVPVNENVGNDVFVFEDSSVTVREGYGALSMATGKLPLSYVDREEEGNADFYSPAPVNVFAGDVMNFYHSGTYHLIYLSDHRHHGSRGGCGAHHITQLTTNDFINWREEEPMLPLMASFESHGTGTMLYHNGKYYMSYGLHTERHTDDAHIKGPTLVEKDGEKILVEENGVTALAHGLFPGGGTYAVSDDGIHFEKTWNVYHFGRNPSAYVNEKGGICAYIGGSVWESEGFGKPFRLTNPAFPPCYTLPTRHTEECPSFFERNGYKYLIMGFTGYFRTLTPGSNEYVDAATLGEEIYDGLCVPMACTAQDGRTVMAGWLDGIGWGSVIMHRELIDEENGRLGMKWMPELIPAVKEENLLCGDLSEENVPLPKSESTLFSCTVSPDANGLFALILEDEEGKGCEIRINLATLRAQIADKADDGLAEDIPSFLEQMTAADPSVNAYHRLDSVRNIARYTKNFSLTGLRGLDAPFSFRMILRQSRKLNATVLDVEIAKRRTMISLREGFFPTRMRAVTRGKVHLGDATLSRLLHPVK